MVKSDPPNRTDRGIAVLLMAVTLAIYLRAVAPDILPGDPGEFQFAAWRLGLAHPTGYPLYMLLGSAWQHALAGLGIGPAVALNALSSITGALAVGLVYLLMLNWVDGTAVIRRLAASFSALLVAVNVTVWSQSLIAEVYTLHLVLVLCILLMAQVIGLRAHRPTSADISSAPSREVSSARLLIALSFLVGLSLTHHAMTILLVPALIVFLWLIDRRWWRQPLHIWIGIVSALLLPMLLYLYIPLRSGPQASPWYHQQLGNTTLTLYQNSWPAFINFITGRSISVGFNDLVTALGNIRQATWLWWYHFGWPGLLLMGLGVFLLVRKRNWSVLALTLVYAITQQLFNLFYDIGDILVYYMPLYLMGALWAGFAAAGLGTGDWGIGARPASSVQEEPQVLAPDTQSAALPPQEHSIGAKGGWESSVGWLVILILFLIPLRSLSETAPQIDQSNSSGTRRMWESILAAQPEAGAILISNDRNEIVPLFYLQAVESRATDMTGLFPLIAPEPRFADIVATIETALADGAPQPVYLIKEMPGLEIRFHLEAAAPPLVRVLGPVAGKPMNTIGDKLGPLQLVGFDWEEMAEKTQVRLHWLVEDTLDADYTTTVQVFDQNGNKIAQNDLSPGGTYYPTSHWKPGDRLVETHVLDLNTLDLSPDQQLVLLIGMYRSPNFTQLATPLEISLTGQN